MYKVPRIGVGYKEALIKVRLGLEVALAYALGGLTCWVHALRGLIIQVFALI